MPVSLDSYKMGRNIEIDTALRLNRGLEELHMGLFGSPSRFTPVAGGTGADQIFPGMLTVLVAGDNMVESELVAYFSAILAGIVVAVEYLKPAQFGLRMWSFDQIRQSNNRRYGVMSAGCVDISGAIFQHLCLAAENEG
jgi:hypothetical protein